MATIRVPQIDDQMNGTTISSVEPGRSATRATQLHTTGGANRAPEYEEISGMTEGPSPSMCSAGEYADGGDGSDAGLMLGGGATCANAAGQQIVRTSWAVYRSGAPQLGARPAPGDTLCAVWHLSGGGYVYPAPSAEDPRSPASITTTWYDDNGAEFDGYVIPTPAMRRDAAEAARARRCACGNFKTPGHDSCNACRSGPRRPAAPAPSPRRPAAPEPSPKRRKPAPGEEVLDLTGDD